MTRYQSRASRWCGRWYLCAYVIAVGMCHMRLWTVVIREQCLLFISVVRWMRFALCLLNKIYHLSIIGIRSLFRSCSFGFRLWVQIFTRLIIRQVYDCLAVRFLRPNMRVRRWFDDVGIFRWWPSLDRINKLGRHHKQVIWIFLPESVLKFQIGTTDITINSLNLF